MNYSSTLTSNSNLKTDMNSSYNQICQEIISSDAKFNHYRINNNSQLRILYMRRRTQLLRENVSKHKKDQFNIIEIRSNYLHIRNQILEKKYGNLDQISVSSNRASKSKAPSIDSISLNNYSLQESMKRVYATNNQYNTKSSIYSSSSSLNSTNFNNQQRAKSETPPTDTTSFAGVHHIFNNHKGAVTRIRFANKDKSLLASCSLDGSLVICQVIPSPATTIYRLEGHQSGIMDMQWNTTNDLIVTASLDGTARVWQVNKGQCMRILKDTCGAQVLCCCFQPLNENMIFTGNSKGLIQVYNLSTGIIVNKNCLQKVLGRVLCMCFDSTGTNIWIGDDKGTLTAFQFDVFTLKLNKTKKIVTNSGYSITSISYRNWSSKDSLSSALLVNAMPNYLLLYRLINNTDLKLRKRICIKQQDHSIRSTFCPILSKKQIQSCLVTTGSEDFGVYIYDMENDDRPLINKLQGHSAVVKDVSFNYDQSLLASADYQILRNFNKMTSFRLVSEITADETSSKMPVKKFISSRTGIRLYVCNLNGPVIEGYFSLATETFDDDGLPHTLEHMIFLGSKDYPYAGVLDILANKIYASGTNAWTDVDNTTYTLSTVEKCGFLQLLPVYLDHILYPLLNESGYITEVYHVNGEGEDAGVVYSEMQGVENEDENVVQRAMHRTIYPNENCGYRYETGGILKNLRESTSHKKVCDYHNKMYRPDNMAIIVAGQIDSDEIIKVLEKFEEKILANNPDLMKLNERPFSGPIDPLTASSIQTVYFPCDEEKNSNGIVAIGWRGPRITDLKEVIAIDLLFSYLTDSTISPVQSYFINNKSYCSKINYQIEEYRESHVVINFTNTQLEHLEKIKPEFDFVLDEMIDNVAKFDVNRMVNLIKMKISEINDKFEDEPHQTVSKVCIGDFLCGSLENQIEFKQRFSQTDIFEELKNESAEFWLKLADRYLRTHSVTVIAKPCEQLMKDLGDQDKQRVNERKKKLGKKGLKDLKKIVENSIDQNDETEVPDSVYESLQVPSLENVKMKQIKQFHTYDNGEIQFEPIKTHFKNLDSVKHLQLQVDHLEGTNFVQATLLIDTVQLDPSLKVYLELFTSLLFESPIRNSEVDLTHGQVVYELNKDLLEFGSSLGINGSQFEPGIFSEYFTVFIKVPIRDYELGIKWIKWVLFNTVFDNKQILIAVSNLLKEIKKRKQQPSDLIHSVLNDIYFKEEANMCKNNFLKQEAFLQDIQDTLTRLDDNTTINKLNELRNSILIDKKLRFYMCADIDKLSKLFPQKLDSIWLEHFPANYLFNEKELFTSNKEFCVQPAWKLKKITNENLQNTCSLFTPSSKRDFLINLGTSESAYLSIRASLDIDSYYHPNYASLLVLIEYFCQVEGPLWEAVRGPGYCYHQSISLSPELAIIELNLTECSNLTKAYEATRKIFLDHMNDKDEFDENLLETAKNSLIFLLIDDLKSMSSISAFSMSCLFKGVEINAVIELIKRIEKVEMKELIKLLKTYIIPLFNDEYSNCLIACHPAKSESTILDFSQNFDRKLNLIGKIDECLCAI